MAYIIDFYQAKKRLRPVAPAERQNFLIVEIPEEMMKKLEKAPAPLSAHIDLILY